LTPSSRSGRFASKAQNHQADDNGEHLHGGQQEKEIVVVAVEVGVVGLDPNGTEHGQETDAEERGHALERRQQAHDQTLQSPGRQRVRQFKAPDGGEHFGCAQQAVLRRLPQHRHRAGVVRRVANPLRHVISEITQQNSLRLKKVV
jgi:hypothetical protein